MIELRWFEHESYVKDGEPLQYPFKERVLQYQDTETEWKLGDDGKHYAIHHFVWKDVPTVSDDTKA